MAYTLQTATTKSITSVVSGTAVTGGNAARFTHASGTAFPVGDFIINTGGTLSNPYQQPARVTVSAATYYELQNVLYTATATGTGTSACIIQTGTEVLNLAAAAPTGMTKTTRGNKAFFSLGTNSLRVDGTLTINSTEAEITNTAGTTGISIGAGGILNIDGRRSTAANAPFPDAGMDWLWTGNGNRSVIRLDGTSGSRAILNLYDACIRFGSAYLIIPDTRNGTINTYGDICWVLPNSTAAGRVRVEGSETQGLNLQAIKTYIGSWLNISLPQPSLKGFTPLATDGVEVNAGSITAVTTFVPLENYDTTFIVFGNYNSHLTLYLGNWARLKNGKLGTNITVLLHTVSGTDHNVVDFSAGISATSKTADGTALSDGILYWLPTGSNVSGIRPKGYGSDITYDLSLKKTTYVAGAAVAEFIFAWQYNNVTTYHSSYRYFCATTTRGAESHPIWSSRYGYDKQTQNPIFAGLNDKQLVFSHASLPTSTKDIADAAAITGITINDAVTSITIANGSTKTIQELYDRYQWQLQQDASLFVVDTCVIDGATAKFVGKTLTLGGIITGGNFTGVKFTTIVMTSGGTIVGLELFETKVTVTAPSILEGLDRCKFTRGSVGHAIEITGTAGNVTLDGNTFTGYAATNGSTGNEAIFVNIATGSMTINIIGGGTTPTIRTAGCTVTVTAIIQLTLTGFIAGSDVVILAAGTSTVRNSVDSVSSYVYSYQTVEAVDICLFKAGYIPLYIRNYTLGSSNASLPISQVIDRFYIE